MKPMYVYSVQCNVDDNYAINNLRFRKNNAALAAQKIKP